MLLQIPNGGTGAPTAAGARVNLGLGPNNSPTFAGLTVTGNVSIGGTLTVTGESTFNADILIAEATPKITLRDTNGVGTTTSTWLAFEDSTPTRIGYVGFGSSGTDTLHINNETATGDIELRTNGSSKLTVGPSSIVNSLATTITANAAPLVTLNRTGSTINTAIRYLNDTSSIYAGVGAANTFSISTSANLASGGNNWVDVTDGKIEGRSTSTAVSVADLAFSLYRDHSSLTTTGGLGRLEFNGNNSAGTKTWFGGIAATAGGSITAGSEYGYIYLQAVLNGVASNVLRAGGVDSLVEVLQGKLKFPETQSSSSDPNVLDDYEEGSFTPTIVGVTTAGTGTYSQNDGYYVKIGRFVWVGVQIVQTAHTGTGAMRITGLPFSNSSINPALSLWGSQLTVPANTAQLQAIFSGTSILMYSFSDAGVAAELAMDTVCTIRAGGWYMSTA